MHTSPVSRSWLYFLGPAFIVTLLAWSSVDAEAAPTRTTAPAKAPTTKAAPAKKTAANNSKNKKKTAGKKKNKGKKAKHHKKHRKNAKGKTGGGSGGLISQIRRDEARLEADLSRLRKLLR